jgi:hypothetical protein
MRGKVGSLERIGEEQTSYPMSLGSLRDAHHANERGGDTAARQCISPVAIGKFPTVHAMRVDEVIAAVMGDGVLGFSATRKPAI